MAEPKQGKSIAATLALYPRQWEYLEQYAIDNGIYWRGVPSVSGALQAILNEVMENKGMGEK